MTIQEKINFPSTSKIDWIKMAAQELNDSDPIAKLSKNIAGTLVKPYYDATDVSQEKNDRINSEFKSWLNVPKISVHDAKQANTIALDHLNAGADGILFDLKSNAQAEQLLKGIELQHCHIFFILNKSSHPFYNSFKSLVTSQKVKPTGAFYFPDEAFFSEETENFKINGLQIETSENCVKQISLALRGAALRMQALTDLGMSAKGALQSLAFLWPMKTNFFISISEMRAMRMLWHLFSEAYGVSNVPLFLHAYSFAWTNKKFQPHSNLIKQTTSGLAAVLGNCHALTCEAENEEIKMLARTSRNISSILKEESHLDKVTDPLAGSYFIEQVSNELAEKAWRKFQEIV